MKTHEVVKKVITALIDWDRCTDSGKWMWTNGMGGHLATQRAKVNVLLFTGALDLQQLNNLAKHLWTYWLEDKNEVSINEVMYILMGLKDVQQSVSHRKMWDTFGANGEMLWRLFTTQHNYNLADFFWMSPKQDMLRPLYDIVYDKAKHFAERDVTNRCLELIGFGKPKADENSPILEMINRVFKSGAVDVLMDYPGDYVLPRVIVKAVLVEMAENIGVVAGYERFIGNILTMI